MRKLWTLLFVITLAVRLMSCAETDSNQKADKNTHFIKVYSSGLKELDLGNTEVATELLDSAILVATNSKDKALASLALLNLCFENNDLIGRSQLVELSYPEAEREHFDSIFYNRYMFEVSLAEGRIDESFSHLVWIRDNYIKEDVVYVDTMWVHVNIVQIFMEKGDTASACSYLERNLPKVFVDSECPQTR